MKLTKMHLLSMILFHLFCLPTSIFGLCPTADSLEGSNNCAKLYTHSHPNYNYGCGGDVATMGNGDSYNLGTAFKNEVSGLVVQDDCTLVAYDERDYGGNSHTFTGSNPRLKDVHGRGIWNKDWNDDIVSARCYC